MKKVLVLQQYTDSNLLTGVAETKVWGLPLLLIAKTFTTTYPFTHSLVFINAMQSHLVFKPFFLLFRLTEGRIQAPVKTYRHTWPMALPNDFR